MVFKRVKIKKSFLSLVKIQMTHIQLQVKKLLKSIPEHVQLVVAAKSRSMDEVKEVLETQNLIIGENYIQEAEKVRATFKQNVTLHFIGHLQKNKINKAIETCDLIQTVDSVKLAERIEKRCGPLNKTMPILIEINSGREPQKNGAMPEDAIKIIETISHFKYVQIKGLMTMGPFTHDPEKTRPYFQTTKELFDQIQTLQIPNVKMEILSMGMSNSYAIAIEEGATMIRIGSAIFGPRFS